VQTAVIAAIDAASEKIQITTPYFLPSNRVRNAILRACKAPAHFPFSLQFIHFRSLSFENIICLFESILARCGGGVVDARLVEDAVHLPGDHLRPRLFCQRWCQGIDTYFRLNDVNCWKICNFDRCIALRAKSCMPSCCKSTTSSQLSARLT